MYKLFMSKKTKTYVQCDLPKTAARRIDPTQENSEALSLCKWARPWPGLEKAANYRL